MPRDEISHRDKLEQVAVAVLATLQDVSPAQADDNLSVRISALISILASHVAPIDGLLEEAVALLRQRVKLLQTDDDMESAFEAFRKLINQRNTD